MYVAHRWSVRNARLLEPLAPPRTAAGTRDHVPGVHLPDNLISRSGGADKPRIEGMKLCIELTQRIREINGISGVHLVAHRQEKMVAEIIDASCVLKDRKPWCPEGDPLADALRYAS